MIPLRPPADDRETYKLFCDITRGFIAMARYGLVRKLPGEPHPRESKELLSIIVSTCGPVDNPAQAAEALSQITTEAIAAIESGSGLYGHCMKQLLEAEFPGD